MTVTVYTSRIGTAEGDEIQIGNVAHARHVVRGLSREQALQVLALFNNSGGNMSIDSDCLDQFAPSERALWHLP